MPVPRRGPQVPHELVAPETQQRWLKMRPLVASDWLRSLPESVARCAAEWHISDLVTLRGGSMSVALAGIQHGRGVVIKLSPPWTQWGRWEAQALEAWGGQCAPRLLAHSKDGRQLLMERIEPGSPATGLDPASVAHLIGTISSPRKLEASEFDDLARAVSDRFERAAATRHDLLPAHVVQAAYRCALGVCAQPEPPQGIVHGDLLAKNILCAGSTRLVVIDPHPTYGDPCYDAALWSVTERPLSDIARRVHCISRALGVNPDRVWSWVDVLAAAEVCLAPKPRATETLRLLESRAPVWFDARAN